MPKIFLFDRDSTLFDGQNNLINPDFMRPYLTEVIAHHPWGIVSTGASALSADDAVKKLKYGENKPAYPRLGSGNDSTLNALVEDSLKFQSKVFENVSEENKHQMILGALLFGELDEANNTLTYERRDHEGNNCKVTMTFNEDTTFKIKFKDNDEDENKRCKENLITINLKNWLAKRDLHGDGRNKLFQCILALEQLGYVPEITQELRDLGIEDIKCQENNPCTVINLKDVVMLDDSKGVIDLLTAAGMTAIRADTHECKFREGETVTRDTYMRELAKYFPKLAKYLPKKSVSLLELASIIAVEAIGLTLIAAGALALAVSFGAAITLPAIVMTLPLLPIGIATVAIGAAYMALPIVVVAASKVKDAFFTSKSTEKLDESTSLIFEDRPQN